MKARIISALLIVAIAVGFSTTSFAQSTSKKIETARTAPLTLVDAINKTEARLSGQAYEIEIDRESKRDVYEIYLTANGGIYEVYVDVTDGKLIKQTLKKGKEVRLAKPLTEIIEIALKTQPGVAFEVECKSKKKDTLCEVEIVAQNGDIYEVVVDASTGGIVSIELD